MVADCKHEGASTVIASEAGWLLLATPSSHAYCTMCRRLHDADRSGNDIQEY
jgi:hypothetical protein